MSVVIMISVKALAGTQCPKEGAPRKYISDAVAEDVPATAYYRRLIDDGSLIVQPTGAKPRSKK